MALNALIFDNRNNDSQNWRRIFQNLYGDGILRGCEITFTSNSVAIADGLLMIAGGAIDVNGSTTISIVPTITSGYVRLKIQIDLSNGSEASGSGPVSFLTEFSATSTFLPLTQEDINGAGEVYEQEIAVFQISGGNVTSTVRTLANLAGFNVKINNNGG